MLEIRKNESEQSNPIITKIKTENSNSKENINDTIRKDKEIVGFYTPNQSLFSLKKEKIHNPKTSENSLKNYFCVENILNNSKIIKTDNNSLTERLFLNDEDIAKMKKKLNDLKQGNKRIFNLEKEIEETSKSICDLKDSIHNLTNLNFKHDNSCDNNCNRNLNYEKIKNSRTNISNNIGHIYNITNSINLDNNDSNVSDKFDNNLNNNLGLVSFFIEQMKIIELALEGKDIKIFNDNNISLTEEDSTYKLMKKNVATLINKINLLYKDNLKNRLEISNELETEKNKNMELLLKIKNLNKENFSLKKEIEMKMYEINQLNNKLNQNEITIKSNNSLKNQNNKANYNNYMIEINNLNLKLKKLSILFEKNDILLKQITEENKELKKKNLELENQIISNKKASFKNNNLFNKNNNSNSNYDPLEYIMSFKKNSTPKLNDLILLNQEENDDINNFHLQKETDKLIKENYVGNIINLKNNYLMDESNKTYNSNNSYLFKNLKKKQKNNKVYDRNNKNDYHNYINKNIEEYLGP